MLDSTSAANVVIYIFETFCLHKMYVTMHKGCRAWRFSRYNDISLVSEVYLWVASSKYLLISLQETIDLHTKIHNCCMHYSVVGGRSAPCVVTIESKHHCHVGISFFLHSQ